MKDDYGITIQNVRDKLDVKLSDQTAAELAKRPCNTKNRVYAAAGSWRDQGAGPHAETGRIRTYQAAFTIPN